MVFALAGRAGYSDARTAELAATVADELTDMGQLAAAGQVLVAHLGDVDNGVVALCRRGHLVDTVIGPLAAEAAGQLLEDCKQGAEKSNKYLGRGRGLRERRATLEAALAVEAHPGRFCGQAGGGAQVKCRD